MSGRNKVTGTVAIAASASLALAACGGAAGGPQTDGEAKLTNDKVVIGLLNDQSGVYKDLSGPNSKVAIEMAIADYQAKYGDDAVAKTIEVVQTDHQNKPDIANTKAQEMYDRQNADIILDVPTSRARPRRRRSCTSTSEPPRPRSPVSRATSTRSTGPTTPTCSPTARAPRPSRTAARRGRSSTRTTPSART
jgi:hypothetical protein